MKQFSRTLKNILCSTSVHPLSHQGQKNCQGGAGGFQYPPGLTWINNGHDNGNDVNGDMGVYHPDSDDVG